tara:strand:+ start:543 stop:935 length:393 start_codon:yes stop_codon:yes gene_type:complete
MSNYRVVFEDPEQPEQPAVILVPSDQWLEEAKAGLLPPISVHWALQDDERQAIAEDRHETFEHDPEKHAEQWTAPRIGPLTEEEAIEYLIMKDVPRHVWSVEYNRPMFKIVRTEDVPSDRQFRNAWRLAA